MSRSLKVRSDSIKQAKLALQHNGFGSQRALAEELGLALSTLSRFLTGKTVDCATFVESVENWGSIGERFLTWAIGFHPSL